MWAWLVRDWQWPAASLFATVFLLAMLPMIAVQSGLMIALVYAQLPIYMIHQWEEHTGDRFRKYMNRVIGKGREALTPEATFWINSLGVWAVDLLAVYLAWMITPSAGLVAGYLAIVNAILHIGPAMARREYNPGLVTAVLLFIPLGGWCVIEVGSEAGLTAHVVGLASAISVHVVVVVHVIRRLARLAKHAETPAETTPHTEKPGTTEQPS